MQVVPASMVDVDVASVAMVGTSIATRVPTGVIVPFAGASAPTEWLLCDGSAVSRTAYANLFVLLGTTYGGGDGSTTFNVPDIRGRMPLGVGTGQDVETVTSQSASGNAIPVASNNSKWFTGRQVTVSGVSGFTGLANGTWYIVRASASTVQFATSLANAQNGTVAAITGTGSCTVAASHTARTLGEKGGEETHAMSSSELPAHTHAQKGQTVWNVSGGGSASLADSVGTSTFASTTASTGANNAMNIMQPFIALNYIIRT